ncbi:MAG: hypothetical protein GW947_02185 [Candidatus Pacebacteria bacterium]|nr:hypothetical protein [Candidatus Paceibacterota bacterium]
MTELPTPNWDLLPPLSRSFVKPLLGEYHSERTILPLFNLLLNPNSIPEVIADTRRALETLQVNPDSAKSPRVIEGYRVLKVFFTERLQYLRDNKIVVLVYGSMRYDDPVNLDYDILCVVPSHAKEFVSTLIDWMKELDHPWDSLVGYGGHLTFVGLEDIREYATEIGNGNLEFITSNCMDISMDMMGAAILITGYAGFTPDPKLCAEYRQRVLELASTNAILQASIAENLLSVLTIRQERRVRDVAT